MNFTHKEPFALVSKIQRKKSSLAASLVSQKKRKELTKQKKKTKICLE